MNPLFPAATAVALATLLIVTPPASSNPPPETPARYKGRTIDLAKDWEGAQACLVLSSKRGDVRCFATEAEMRRELATGARRISPLGTELDTYCLNRNDLALTLYTDTNYGGSSVSFVAANVWHNLSGYSFDDITSSWRNNTYCDATGATGTGGTGSTLTMAARSQNPDVGSTWNDVLSSVRINA